MLSLVIRNAKMPLLYLHMEAVTDCTILYWHMEAVRLYHIYSHYLMKGIIVGGGDFIEYKVSVLIFSTNFDRKIDHYKKHWARYYHKCS